MVLKAHLLCTWGQDKTRGRVLGEVEKDSFIILPGKGGDTTYSCLETLCVSIWRCDEKLYSNGWKRAR